MKKNNFKRQLVFVMFMVLGCLAIHAADDDLITRQITIKLEKAGTLPDKFGSARIYKITNLKIIGEINGTDLRFIRFMAGRDTGGGYTAGKLATLDLSEAKIVEGGDYYYSLPPSDHYYTSNDEIGWYAFEGCSSLTSVCVSWESPLSIEASTFENVNTKKCILYVPKGTYDDYLLSNWGVFENIEEYDVTGINQVTKSSDAKEVSRYSADGQRLETPSKGLNIVKYSDGTVKKVVVQ